MLAPDKLMMSTGKTATEYLRMHQENWPWPDGTPVCVIRQSLLDEIAHLRSLQVRA